MQAQRACWNTHRWAPPPLLPQYPGKPALGWSPRLYIAHQFPGHAAVAGPWHTENFLTPRFPPLSLSQLGTLCHAQPVTKGWTAGT